MFQPIAILHNIKATVMILFEYKSISYFALLDYYYYFEKIQELKIKPFTSLPSNLVNSKIKIYYQNTILSKIDNFSNNDQLLSYDVN